MSETRGVFSLSRVFAKKRNNQWVLLDDVWIDYPTVPVGYNAGYFGGGSSSSTTMHKLDYSTDTTVAAPGTQLSVNRSQLGATGNSDAGYFGGGSIPIVATMDKLTYSSDTTAEVPTAALSFARNNTSAATGNSTAGYFGGGYNPGGVVYSTMDKVTYSTDTTAAVSGASMTVQRYLGAATGNQTHGYFGAGAGSPGESPGLYTTMDKVTYSTDTTAAVPGANLSLSRYHPTATGNSEAGYFTGGWFIPSSPGIYSTTEKVTYSSDTRAVVPGANLSVGRYSLGATGNSTDGYFGGGRSPSTVTTMDKLDYSTDTTAENPGAALPNTRFGGTASSSRANALPAGITSESTRFSDGLVEDYPSTGYNGGGNNFMNNMHRIQYANDVTLLLPSSLLNTPRREFSAVASTTAGYFGGGRSPAPLSSIEKITFSTETTAEVPGAAFAATRYGSGSAGNLTQGYFAGGNPGSASSTYKLTYSTETSALASSANLSFPAYRGISGTGNLTAGYFAMGYGPGGQSSTIDKITYSTDTSTSAVSNQTGARYVRGATGNSTHGYFAGGYPGPLSAMDKITYSTETTAQSTTAFLSAARRYVSATGSTSQGYFLGGLPSQTTTDKLTYSSDTAAQSPSASLSSADYRTASCSKLANAFPSAGLGPDVPRTDSTTPTLQTVYNLIGSQSGPVPSSGFTFGGNPNTDKIEEINFSTETFTTLTSKLTNGGLGGTALGNSSAGYHVTSVYTNIDKLIFAGDTKSLLPATTTRSFYFAGSAGNSTFGYFALGAPGYRTDVDKLTYSTETIGLVSGLQFSVGRNGPGSVSSTTHAYFGGGYEYPPGGPGSHVSTVNKIQYSNDTLSTISSPLSAARNYLTGTGNSTAGYFTGGGGGGYLTYTDKLVYSTDTTAAVPTAFRVNPLSSRAAGNTSTTAGYFSGGYYGGQWSITERLTYSTDTMAQAPGANLSEAKSHTAGRGPLSNTLPSSAQVAVPTPVYL